ncbi:MAG: Mitochondrial intermediate peptidase [Claussenomyces sp. TS43310]|nr:MAG: Mitochondrial intermediate peptidase [Claussenomyces sp. TS43310]
MLKTHTSRPWICARCISRLGHGSKRSQSIAAGSAYSEPRPTLVDNSAPGALHDDRTLRQIFDSQGFWKDFSQSSNFRAARENVGLFRNRYLTSPQGFVAFSENNLEKANRIVEKVLAASTVEEYKNITKHMDRLSDMLCRVIDLSEFVRSTHPDSKIQAAASRAHAKMFEYMNQLNTMTGLNDQLAVAMASEEVVNTWTEEERVVARALKKDFSNSAISLPRAVRERFVTLSQEISEIGPDFVDFMEPEKSAIAVPVHKLRGMDPRLAKRLSSWGKASLPTMGDTVIAALRSVQDEEVRKDLLIANRTASKSQLRRLDVLLQKRGELATVTKYDSYGHLALGDKMAKSPESVNRFLQALSKGNRSKAVGEMGELLKVKMKNPGAASPVLQPWDKDYYMNQIRSSMRSSVRNSDFLSAYFSLGTVMQGLSRVFTRLYGIRFVPHETAPGETWNEDVRRLDVVSEEDGHVAVLYCDLFSRPGKSPNPAHFTLRCSREIGKNEVDEEAQSPNSLFSSPEEAVNDGMATSHASGTLKQLPTIALICDFRTTSKPSLLTFGEVQTLFHEMGHAIHSILGRTSLQEVSGTRCATDFAELPSVFMEHFAADPATLSLFARHYETDQPLPYEMVAEHLALERHFKGMDTENQIILSMIDQAYHSTLPLSPSFNSTEVCHNLQRQFGVLPPDPPETSWQGFFGHLYVYGASYYSYLFDQVLAERIWQVVFKAGRNGASIDRANGEKMKGSLLKWGGGRDPWHCVADVLDDGRVEEGGERAMEIVGTWGTGGEDV